MYYIIVVYKINWILYLTTFDILSNLLLAHAREAAHYFLREDFLWYKILLLDFSTMFVVEYFCNRKMKRRA